MQVDLYNGPKTVVVVVVVVVPTAVIMAIFLYLVPRRKHLGIGSTFFRATCLFYYLTNNKYFCAPKRKMPNLWP